MIFYNRKVQKLIDPRETEKRLREEPLDLEKGDKKAILIAAMLVFFPVVLGFCGLIALLAFLFLR